jgi:hypothetical protein
VARAVRDLLADCLSTLPALIERDDPGALHFHFATFDAPRRQLFPEAWEAYERFLRDGGRAPLRRIVAEGRQRWLATARRFLALEPEERASVIAALVPDSAARKPPPPRPGQDPPAPAGRRAS